jgi:hypothetical protein
MDVSTAMKILGVETIDGHEFFYLDGHECVLLELTEPEYGGKYVQFVHEPDSPLCWYNYVNENDHRRLVSATVEYTKVNGVLVRADGLPFCDFPLLEPIEGVGIHDPVYVVKRRALTYGDGRPGYTRTFDIVTSNVPHLVTYHSPTGFEFGYRGSGPADLSLNIVEDTARRMGFHRSHYMSDESEPITYEAVYTYGEFKDKYVASVGDVLVIRHAQVEAFILDAIQRYASERCAGLRGHDRAPGNVKATWDGTEWEMSNEPQKTGSKACPFPTYTVRDKHFREALEGLTDKYKEFWE